MVEEWKRIKTDELVTKYEISNLGRCRNSEKLNWKSGGILNPKFNKANGYYSYTICDKSWTKNKYMYAHRLVLQHFQPIDNIELQVNHKDGNKTNNRLDNLEWCTRIENMQHASKNELIGKPIIQYSLKGEFIARFSSATEVKRELGFNQRAISAILTSNSNLSQSNGFQWRFENDIMPVTNITESYKAHKKAIVQLDMEGNFIEYFDKATTAYKKFNKVNNGNISQVCKGRGKTLWGFKWKYATDYYESLLI